MWGGGAHACLVRCERGSHQATRPSSPTPDLLDRPPARPPACLRRTRAAKVSSSGCRWDWEMEFWPLPASLSRTDLLVEVSGGAHGGRAGGFRKLGGCLECACVWVRAGASKGPGQQQGQVPWG
jgi:hypothetical protein